MLEPSVSVDLYADVCASISTSVVKGMQQEKVEERRNTQNSFSIQRNVCGTIIGLFIFFLI